MKINKLIRVDIVRAKAIKLDIVQSHGELNLDKSDGLTTGEYILEIPKSVSDETIEDTLKLEPHESFLKFLRLIRSEYFDEAKKKTVNRQKYPLFKGNYIKQYWDCEIIEHNKYWTTSLIQTNLTEIESIFNKEVEEARQRAFDKIDRNILD